VRSVFVSVRVWIIEVVSAWFAWAIAILTGLADAAKTIIPNFDVPRPALIGGYAGAFIAANVWAFHKMRIRAIIAKPVATTGPITLHPPSTPDSSLVVATAQHRAEMAQLGIANPLAGKFQIRQFASPLEHNENGCVIRVVIAADCLPTKGELRSATKDALNEALSRSSLEEWVSEQAADQQANPDADWVLTSPNSGYIATLKRDWGTSISGGSLLLGKATLHFPQE
jgi:hypothetical protein